jgi:hypothetical protein
VYIIHLTTVKLTFTDSSEKKIIFKLCYFTSSDSAEMITDSSAKIVIFKLCYFISSDSAEMTTDSSAKIVIFKILTIV